MAAAAADIDRGDVPAYKVGQLSDSGGMRWTSSSSDVEEASRSFHLGEIRRRNARCVPSWGGSAAKRR
jgi:hypothetical protein